MIYHAYHVTGGGIKRATIANLFYTFYFYSLLFRLRLVVLPLFYSRTTLWMVARVRPSQDAYTVAARYKTQITK